MKHQGDGTAEALRTVGLRATRQRIALLEALRLASAPESVEAIAGRKRNELDLATAYRSLQEFERAGLARRVVREGGSTLYEVVGTHHHHLMCRSCGAMEDVDVCLPKTLSAKLLAGSKRFARIEDHALEFFGVCTSCSKKKT